jgi:hypothetical protein
MMINENMKWKMGDELSLFMLDPFLKKIDNFLEQKTTLNRIRGTRTKKNGFKASNTS